MDLTSSTPLSSSAPQYPSRRALAGSSGGIFTHTGRESTYGFEYISPTPPRYSAIDLRRDSISITQFMALVETDHDMRVDRYERAQAMGRAIVSLENSEDEPQIDVETSARSQESPAESARPVPSRHQDYCILPAFEEVRDRMETMSINSDDSFSGVSYRTVDLERDLDTLARRSSTARLRRAGDIMRSLNKAVGGKVNNLGGRVRRGLSLRKMKTMKRGKENSAGGEKSIGPSSTDDAGTNHGMASLSSTSRSRPGTPGAPAISSPALPAPPKNTPATPYNIRTLFNLSRLHRQESTPTRSPQGRHPLRMYPDTRSTASPSEAKGNREEGAAADADDGEETAAGAIEDLEERALGNEMRQANEVFFEEGDEIFM